MGQRFQFILVKFDLARLLHLFADVGHKQGEKFLLLVLQQHAAVTNLI